MKANPMGGFLLLLDAGGVLLDDPFDRLISELALEQQLDADSLWDHYYENIRTPLWTGAMPESEFWQTMGPTVEKKASAWRGWLVSLMSALPAIDKLAAWHSRATIGVLSNHRTDWLVPALEASGVTDYIDQMYVSDSIGFAKPDPDAYRHVIRESGLEPDRILFVDDKERNLITARDCGISTILATTDHDWLTSVDEALIDQISDVIN